MEKNLLVFSNYYTCWNVICSYSPFFLLVAPAVWTSSGGLLSRTHSGIPSGLLAHLAVLQGVLFRQHFSHNLLERESVLQAIHSVLFFFWFDCGMVWYSSGRYTQWIICYVFDRFSSSFFRGSLIKTDTC